MDPYLESPRHNYGFHNKFLTHLETTLQPYLPEPYYADTNIRTIYEPPDDPRREAFAEIYYNRNDERRLVTVIELLSRSNKAHGEQGRDLYLRTQRQILGGQVNLVEIDLLRSGVHSTAVPREQAEKQAGTFDYHVSVYRFYEANRYYVYPIRLADRLPVISIPLLPEDGNVPLDLQAVFDRCYDEGAYRRKVHYESQTLDPPLGAELDSWAQSILASNRK
jgi:hypothetical protein